MSRRKSIEQATAASLASGQCVPGRVNLTHTHTHTHPVALGQPGEGCTHPRVFPTGEPRPTEHRPGKVGRAGQAGAESRCSEATLRVPGGAKQPIGSKNVTAQIPQRQSPRACRLGSHPRGEESGRWASPPAFSLESSSPCFSPFPVGTYSPLPLSPARLVRGQGPKIPSARRRCPSPLL